MPQCARLLTMPTWWSCVKRIRPALSWVRLCLAGKRLEIHGVPGNDMACYMDGGEIEVFGNAQDQVANTMNDGDIVIHGRVGDAAGYGMRGGRILVRDGCGWRVGIHMKQYEATRRRLS